VEKTGWGPGVVERRAWTEVRLLALAFIEGERVRWWVF